MLVRSMGSGPLEYDLTERELDVLRLILEGINDDDIAERLGISSFGVNQHVQAIRSRLCAGSRTEAAVRAIKNGLVK